MLQICRTVAIECRPLLTPAPLCCIVLKSDDHVAVSRSEDAQREPVFSQYGLLNQSAHLASAREITVLIESVAVGSTASSENARLLDAVFATFRAIARNSKVETLIVKIKEGKPAFCDTACEIIAARRYAGKIPIDVEARGLSRGMLKMLEDFQR
nr:hypothetical protein B0A51_04353 [Rachicladosporium sp. CCFEE 5018]